MTKQIHLLTQGVIKMMTCNKCFDAQIDMGSEQSCIRYLKQCVIWRNFIIHSLKSGNFTGFCTTKTKQQTAIFVFHFLNEMSLTVKIDEIKINIKNSRFQIQNAVVKIWQNPESKSQQNAYCVQPQFRVQPLE